MAVVAGELRADFSQVELHSGLDEPTFDAFDLGLANTSVGNPVVLTTARQHGTLRVEVQVAGSRPPVDDAWDAACEFSLRPPGLLFLSGWGAEGRLDIPAPLDRWLRVRYVVIAGQEGTEQFSSPRDDEPPIERYLLQVWPEEGSPAAIVVSTVPWSQYWTFGEQARAAVDELADTPDPDRLVAVIDRALAEHPDVVERLRAGDDRYRVGIVRYAQRLFQVTYHTGAYDDVRDDHQRLHRLIDERARA
jgi:hypothetical protein